MSGTHSNSFIFDQSFPDLVETLSFFILNFCSRSRNLKIFADSEKGTSRFSFQQLEELRAFWDKIKSSFSLPIWDWKFRTMNWCLNFYFIIFTSVILSSLASQLHSKHILLSFVLQFMKSVENVSFYFHNFSNKLCYSHHASQTLKVMFTMKLQCL